MLMAVLKGQCCVEWPHTLLNILVFADKIARKTIEMPKKIRELISELEKAGFLNRGGKGSYRNFIHPLVMKPMVISGKMGDDAKKYQEKAVEAAIEESKK